MAKSKHFMVVLCGDFSQRLEIPRKFLKHIKEVVSKLEKSPKQIKLADTTGRMWCVSIERDGHKTHFTSGWPKFAREHRLQENEFIQFRYDGNRQFSVVIFDDTLCERHIIVKVSSKEVPEVVSLSDSEDSESVASKKCGATNEVMSEEDDSEDYESESSFMNKSKKRGSSPYPSSGNTMGDYFVSRRRAVTDSEKQKAATAAFSFSSKNPHIMIRMSANVVYFWSCLRLSVQFSKDYLPRKNTMFVLRNSAGQKWISSYYVRIKPYAAGISRGWTHFARDNNLEEDDYCVFELVKSTEFLVHIFRVV